MGGQNTASIDHLTGTILVRPNVTWKWGPARKHTPFAGLYQFQHITIHVHGELDSNDLSPKLGEVKCRDIAYRDVPGAPVNWKDIDVNLVEFTKLVGRLREMQTLEGFSTKTHELRYQNSNNKRAWIIIDDDGSLSRF